MKEERRKILEANVAYELAKEKSQKEGAPKVSVRIIEQRMNLKPGSLRIFRMNHVARKEGARLDLVLKKRKLFIGDSGRKRGDRAKIAKIANMLKIAAIGTSYE